MSSSTNACGFFLLKARADGLGRIGVLQTVGGKLSISEYMPQAKGIERAVCFGKEGIYTNWLAFEESFVSSVRVELFWRRYVEHVEARSRPHILLP